MEESELKKLIRLGESSKIEFKEDSVQNDRLVQEICAFANFKGGRILLGVADDGSCKGLTREDNEERIMNLCSDSLNPRIIPEVEYELLEEKKILILTVDPGLEKTYAVLKQGKRRYYIRVGSSSRESNQQELRRMFQDSGKLHAETLSIFAKIDDLDQPNLFRYFSDFRRANLETMDKEPLERLLINSALVNENGCLTLAGCLLFCRYPLRFFGGAGISIGVLDGNKITAPLLEVIQLERTLFDNLEDFRIKMKMLNQSKSHQSIEGNGQRKETFDYPWKAVREVMVNAMIHRDYSIEGSQIRVFFYQDFLEVRSPGLLPNSLTVEKMKQGITYHRNPVLLGYFYEKGLIERLGRGIRTLFETLQEHNGTEPEIFEEGGELVVRIWKRKKSNE